MEHSPIFPFLKLYKDRIERIFAGHIHSRAEDEPSGKIRQTTIASGFETGMYALVECSGTDRCRVDIRKAWK